MTEAESKVLAATTPPDDIRFLAMLIRQGLKLIVVGIEKRYGLDEKRDRAA